MPIHITGFVTGLLVAHHFKNENDFVRVLELINKRILVHIDWYALLTFPSK